jgi:hypothetical protein
MKNVPLAWCGSEESVCGFSKYANRRGDKISRSLFGTLLALYPPLTIGIQKVALALALLICVFLVENQALFESIEDVHPGR